MTTSVRAQYAKLQESYMALEKVVNHPEKELKEVKAKLVVL